MIFSHPEAGYASVYGPAHGGAASPDPSGFPSEPHRFDGEAKPLVWPSHSQDARNADRLAKEVELHWVKPASEAPGWLREKFRRHRPRRASLWAYTTDRRGRIVRAFTADTASIAAYAELQRTGYGTCPIEAVWPPSITPGQPAEPAHPYLLQLQEVGQ